MVTVQDKSKPDEPVYDAEIIALRNRANRLVDELDMARAKLNAVTHALTDLDRSARSLAEDLLKKYDSAGKASKP